MDILKKVFPLSFKVEDLKAFVIALVVYVLVDIVCGVVIGLLVKIPVIGVIFSIAALLIFGNTIVVLLDIPKLNSELLYLLALGLRCMVLALVVSVAASLYSVWKVSRNHLDALIKGEEI